MSFDNIVNDFNKKYKEEIITQGVGEKRNIKKIPFSSPYLNHLTRGGFPRGVVVEYFGSEGSGKTTTAIDTIANAQRVFLKEYNDKLQEYLNEDKTLKKGLSKAKITEYNTLVTNGCAKIVYVDLEMRFNDEWAKTLGVDLENNFYLMRPTTQSAEQTLDLLIALCQTKEVGLIVIDSVPYLIPSATIAETLDKKSYGGVSKILTSFLTKITPFVMSSGCSLLLINQLRDSLNPYQLYTTPGGRALRHAASLRIFFKKGDLYNEEYTPIAKSSGQAYGVEIVCKIEKNTVSTPDRILGSYTLDFFKGIAWEYDLLQLLINEGVVVRTGSWFNFTDVETGEFIEDLKTQGLSNSLKALKSNKDLLEKYKKYVEDNFIYNDDRGEENDN